MVSFSSHFVRAQIRRPLMDSEQHLNSFRRSAMRLWAGLFYSVVLICASQVAMAEDWPQFRGPGNAGLTLGKAVPERWGTNQNIGGKGPYPGAGGSPPSFGATRSSSQPP